jgi:hypothetical protein
MLTVSCRKKMLAVFACFGLTVITGQAFAQAVTPPATAVTVPKLLGPPDPVKIAFAEQRGGLIYRLDRAAWLATDAFRPVWRDQPGVALRGWVVEETGQNRLVTFYAQTTAGPIAIGRYGERNGRIITRASRLTGADAALSDAQRRLVDVRERAIAFGRSAEWAQQGIRPCTAASFNSVIIPTSNPDGDYEIYFMTAWVDRATYPMGGHFRVLARQDGTVRFDRAFTSSCLNLPTSQAGMQTAALVLTHVLDPQPTEIHVFAAQTLRLPVYVGIGNTVFSVKGTVIKQERN